MNDFTGSKIALFSNGKLLVFLRDDKPGINNPGLWDFFGGGREGNESPRECAIREIEEETGILLAPEDFVWERPFESINEPGRISYFLAAHLNEEQVRSILLTEGQEWKLMDIDEFMSREDVIEKLKIRLNAYLESR